MSAAATQLSCPAMALMMTSRRVIARTSRRTHRSICSIVRRYSARRTSLNVYAPDISNVYDISGSVIDACEVAMLACVAGEPTMAHTINAVTIRDIRTPTSRTLAGSDAMHTDPDYSGTYVVIRTDNSDQLEGHGLTFTIGRGNEVCVAAANALAPFVKGLTLEAIASDMRGFWRRLTGEAQLRWIGPEKGAI